MFRGGKTATRACHRSAPAKLSSRMRSYRETRSDMEHNLRHVLLWWGTQGLTRGLGTPVAFSAFLAAASVLQPGVVVAASAARLVWLLL